MFKHAPKAVINNPKTIHHSLPCSPSSTPLTPSPSPYFQSKTQALQLLSQLDLYHTKQNYLTSVTNIIQKMQRCVQQQRQRGQILLIVAKGVVKMEMGFNQVGIEGRMVGWVLKYLQGLMGRKEVKRNSSRANVDRIYRGKYKDSTQRQHMHRNSNQDKIKLKDLLLIQRYDIILFQLFKHLQQTNPIYTPLPKPTKQLSNALLDTYKLAKRYLQQSQYQIYQKNIEYIVRGYNCNNKQQEQQVKGRQQKRKHDSGGKKTAYIMLQQNYLLIDSDQLIAQTHLNYQTQRTISSENKITMISKPSSSSLNPSSHRLLRQQHKTRKNSSTLRRPHRHSNSSNGQYTFRSSILNAPTLTKQSYSNSYFKILTRNSTHLLPRGSQLKIPVDKKKDRISRFQLLSQLEAEALEREFQLQQTGSVMDSEEEQGDNNGIRVRRQTSNVYSYYNQKETSKYQEYLQSFFMFATYKDKVLPLVIEQPYNRPREQMHFRIVQPEYGLYLHFNMLYDPEVDFLLTLEEKCQQHLYRHLKVQFQERRCFLLAMKEGTKQPEQSQQVYPNLLRVQDVDSGTLMGFIRKISTYFIQKLRYSKSQLKGLSQSCMKKNLLTPKRKIPFFLHLSSKLINYDMTMHFQQQEAILVREGSVMRYIQLQQQGIKKCVNSQHNYRLIYQHCTLRQWDQISFNVVFISDKMQQLVQMKPKRYRNRRYASKIHQSIIAEEGAHRKLRKTAHNKSSIKLYNQSPQLQSLYQESQFKLLHRTTHNNHSRRDVVVSEKRMMIGQKRREGRNKKEREINRRTQGFVQSVRGERGGFKLVKITAVQTIQGIKYSKYDGYMCRNPQQSRLWKNQPSLPHHTSSPKSCLSIRCRTKTTSIINTKLISFIKPLLNEDHLFLGYLVSQVKILTLSANRCIFVQTYWQKMQKHFIFILSSEYFQILTDINTVTFWQKPFLPTVEESYIPKKREKRTSVMNTLLKIKKQDSLGSSAQKKRMKQFTNDIHQEPCKTNNQARFAKETFQKPKLNNTIIFTKMFQTITTITNMKSGPLMQLKKQIVSHLRNKLSKLASFQWRNHKLFLRIKGNEKTDRQQFEGRQLAVKNVVASTNDPKIAAATQLILIKYKQNNLSNLNCFNQEGLNKISLQHIFIKNNDDLYGRYYNTLNMQTVNIDFNIPKSLFYLKSNHFFEKQPLSSVPVKKFKLKRTITYSTRQDHKRYKYVQLLQFAKQCCLPFRVVENKRKKITKGSFVVPNRFGLLCEEKEEMVVIQIEKQYVRLKTLQGQELITFSMAKMQHFFPFIRELNKKQLKQLLTKRVLQDEDIMQLSYIQQQ